MAIEMLTEEEKKEMLIDAGDVGRRNDFKIIKASNTIVSMDDYIKFLDDIQTIFGPFLLSRNPTPSHNNKL